MLEINDYVRFYVDINCQFEADLLNLLLQAYNLGVERKKKADISCCDGDCDWIEYEGTTKGRKLVIELKDMINTSLKEREKEIADIAIAKFKKEHNIQD